MKKIIYDFLLIILIVPTLSSLLGFLLGEHFSYALGYLAGSFVVLYFLKIRN